MRGTWWGVCSPGRTGQKDRHAARCGQERWVVRLTGESGTASKEGGLGGRGRATRVRVMPRSSGPSYISHSHLTEPSFRCWLPHFPSAPDICTPALRMHARGATFYRWLQGVLPAGGSPGRRRLKHAQHCGCESAWPAQAVAATSASFLSQRLTARASSHQST
jgi:hypothetical protein